MAKPDIGACAVQPPGAPPPLMPHARDADDLQQMRALAQPLDMDVEENDGDE